MSIFQANVCFNVFLGLVTGKVWDFTGFCHVDGIWMGPVKCLVRCVTNCLSKFCHFKWWHAIWSQTLNPLNWFLFGSIFLGILFAFFCWRFNPFVAISSNSSHFKLFEAISSHFKPFGFFWSHLEPFGARLANLYFLFFFFAFLIFFGHFSFLAPFGILLE